MILKVPDLALLGFQSIVLLVFVGITILLNDLYPSERLMAFFSYGANTERLWLACIGGSCSRSNSFKGLGPLAECYTEFLPISIRLVLSSIEPDFLVKFLSIDILWSRLVFFDTDYARLSETKISESARSSK